MTGTPLPSAGFFTGVITNSQAKDAQNDILAFIRQSILGAAVETQLTISSGIITPTGTVHSIETEGGGSTDDLTNVSVSNTVDGQLLLVRCYNAAHVVTLKNKAGGSGQLALYDNSDLVLNSTSKWILFKLNGTIWEEVFRNSNTKIIIGGSIGGTANSITLAPSVAIPAYETTQVTFFIPTASNTSSTVVVNTSGLGNLSIKKSFGGSKVLLDIGDLVAGIPAMMVYDGTDQVLLTGRLLGMPVVSTTTTPYTVTSANNGGLLLVDTTAGNKTVNLPDISTVPAGFTLTVKKTDSSANAISIFGFSAPETIEGASSKYVLALQYEYVRLTSNGTIWNVVAGHRNQYMIIHEQQIANTNGGGFTAGPYVTRQLNTVIGNTIDGASLTTGQFTLPAGTYEIEAFATAMEVNSHKAKLYNVTDSTNTLMGTSEYASSAGSGNSKSWVNGIFTITATKIFELQHRCVTTRTTYGLGFAAGFDTEIYARVKIRKLR